VGGTDQLSGMRTNNAQFALTYALSALVGPKGFLLYNPIIAVALWGLIRAIREKGLFFYEGIVIGAGSAVMVLYYLLFTNNYGGWSYSIRWFVPIITAVVFLFVPLFRGLRPKARASVPRAALRSGCDRVCGGNRPLVPS